MKVDEIQEKRKFLRHGDKKVLAEMANVSVNTVNRYFNGTYGSHYLDSYFDALVKKRKNEVEQASQSIQNQ
ncbi:MAG: helix-turn-helix domain-containing protein [Crocinitomicaceae bacterium]|jgi:hypothetical protein|nr:helix-turn-helix domain-containing protein [Crocinitomicaceae bacterium]